MKASFEKYGPAVDAKIVYIDQSLSYGVGDLGVQVSKMKSAGVDFVTTCMDNNGVVTLAKEMKKQELKAAQSLPNAYDHDFLKEFGDLFEGSYVRTDFVPFEAKDPPEGLKKYLAAMKQAKADPSENSLVGWLNADLFVTGLKGAGAHFDRQSVIEDPRLDVRAGLHAAGQAVRVRHRQRRHHHHALRLLIARPGLSTT